MRGKYREKKSPSEVKEYKNSLGQNGQGLNGTYKIKDSYLAGSDDISSEYDSRYKDTKIAKKPVSLAIGDWVKDNLASILVTAIIIPFSIWIVVSIFDIHEKQAVYTYRLDQLQSDLEDISESIPNKEVMELEISMLKEDVEELNMDSMDQRISVLEEKVEALKE